MNTIRRNWEIRATQVHLANCEYVHENGKIVGGKSPNHKKIREFYKRRDKHLRQHGKRK